MSQPPPPKAAQLGETPAAEVPHDRSVITVRTLVGAALIVLSVLALVFLLSRLVDIILVVVLAIVFAEGIRPLVRHLGTRGIAEPLGIVLVYVVLLGAFTGLAALLVQPIVSEATALAGNFPAYQKQILGFVNNLESQFHFSVNASSTVSGALGAAQQVLFTIASTIGQVVVNFIVVLVVGFMWLVSSERLKRFVVDLFPVRYQPLAVDVIREVGFRTGGFLRATAINALAVGVATGVASWILGLPSPILLGVFSGLIAIVPVVGAVLGVVPPTLIALTIGPLYAVLVLGVMLVIQLVDANTVVPMVMNRVVALPALAVVLALLIGGALAGVIGALLAVPVAAAIQVLTLRVAVPAIHHAQGRRDPVWDEYVPDEPPDQPAARETKARSRSFRRWVLRLRRQ
ncbi:MAG: AI-2E family transporter [Candidatus Dormibacteraeota bacterium]|nr:AI-2E family transporter [Candidatus Dormibacteraeota bacterium]